jgi:hypothetical protein
MAEQERRRGMRAIFSLFAVVWLAAALPAHSAARVELGQLPTGATAAFVQNSAGGWGMEIAGSSAPAIVQSKPARIEVCRSDSDIRHLAVAYKTVRKSAAGVDATATISEAGKVLFRIVDHWTINGAVVSVKRQVEAAQNAAGGFASSIAFSIDPSVAWNDVKFLAPGIVYADPTFDGERSPGGTLNFAARRLVIREDMLPAPMFAISFANGASVTILDPTPRGDSTVAETSLSKPVMTDSVFQFGALGATQPEGGPIEFGFTFPGSMTLYRPGPAAAANPEWARRYHPITQGAVQNYQVSFRFAQNESFRDLTRNSWRWAWATLNPPVTYIDVDQMRRVLTDHLEAQAATIDGRTGIPFVLSTVTDQKQWNWTMIAMGFVGKNLECADQLLRESDRDPSERGQKMRQTGLAIIQSMIQALPTLPLQGTGYDLATGKPWNHVWLAPWLRNATEDMRVLMRAYRRESAHGRLHPEWYNWVKNYVDWLVLQQRADGSFPRRWKVGSNEIEEPTGTASYCPVPLLIMMSEESGNPRYQQAALRAGEYVWSNWGERGLFIGGASDNPNITDKEAGMLSMEAYLSLYDSTKDKRWLERAEAAANFAETWIWIWNLPMPQDADDAKLHWKKGVPTVGLQGITAMAAGGADEYLDWAVSSYARLYKETGDMHYLDVARVLLHDTKSMVALPGRQYDMKGIGWQQEHWSMGPSGHGRGVGGHRFWLPWVSANHLYGITGLEEYDPALFKTLSTKPADKTPAQ